MNERQRNSIAQTNEYLSKHQPLGPLIASTPALDLGICVVIPVYDEPDVERCLASLQRCRPPLCSVEVIVVVNHGVGDCVRIKRRNEATAQRLEHWAAHTHGSRIAFHILRAPELPRKHAGVGSARKLGMDEAVRRFLLAGDADGVIASLDADCECESNYLRALEKYFQGAPRSPGCSIYFEHWLSGNLDPHQYEGAARYELALRYYKNALATARFPYSYYTVGSSMAVRARVYRAEGGMNRRQAGEDFYFLHKFIRLGGFGEVNTTTVRLSARVSNRVPFGTGQAVHGWMTGEQELLSTYSLEVFTDLAVLPRVVSNWYDQATLNLSDFPMSLAGFLQAQNVAARIGDIRQRVASRRTFIERVYRWFDAFMVFKFVKWASAHHHPMRRLEAAACDLLLWRGLDCGAEKDVFGLLERFRHLDRHGGWPSGS